jgi:hypothetical protein
VPGIRYQETENTQIKWIKRVLSGSRNLGILILIIAGAFPFKSMGGFAEDQERMKRDVVMYSGSDCG